MVAEGRVDGEDRANRDRAHPYEEPAYEVYKMEDM
jgi:hypothetical protein